MAEESEDELGDDMEQDMQALAPEVDANLVGKWITDLGGGKAYGNAGNMGVVKGERPFCFCLHIMRKFFVFEVLLTPPHGDGVCQIDHLIATLYVTCDVDDGNVFRGFFCGPVHTMPDYLYIS